MNKDYLKAIGSLVGKLINWLIGRYVKSKEQNREKLLKWKSEQIDKHNKRVDRASLNDSVDKLCETKDSKR